MTTHRKQQTSKPSRTDLVISGVAIAIVGAMFAITVVLAITEPSGPPEFSFDPPSVQVVESGQMVDVQVENVGGHAAESFTVVATLPDGTEIDQDGGWLSPGESDRLTYLVGADVNADEITFEVVAFDAAG